MKIKHISIWCLATALCLLPLSCDKNDPSITLPGSTSVSSVGMNLQVTTNSIIPVKSEAGTLTRVFGDPEDGIIMTEYVSDITDIMPETKGTIVTASNLPTLTNYGSFQVNAYRAFTKGELNETGDKDNTDNDDDAYDNGTKSASTKAVRDFSLTASYSGGSWTWATPHWRNKSVFSIWSMAPASSANLSPASMTTVNGDPITMPEPDWTDLSSVGAVADTLTASQIQQIQAKFRSLTFDYTLPAYAPATNSTSIYKDLLFAYNEEMREFEEEDGKLKEDANGDNIIKDGKSKSFNVTFSHALAAVKFVLNTETTGADIHSVTLCYTDTDGNIVTTDGIATKGTCTASATQGDGSCPVGFSWTSLTNKKPMHFVFNDGTSSTTKVSGGYANTGDGVLFMIPQSATGLKVIVEFSKYGGTEYYTKVITSPSTSGLNINWEAGKCYTYTFKIGEFHVPGELLKGSGTITVDGFQNGNSDNLYEQQIPSKNVKKIGLIVNNFTYKDNGNGGAVLTIDPNGNGPEVTLTKNSSGIIINDSLSPRDDVEVDFLPIIADGTLGTSLTSFGNGETESYDPYYYYHVGTTTTFPGPIYYAFDLHGADTFDVVVYGYSNSSNAKIDYNIKALLVLEVVEDPNIPNNFYGIDAIDWANI